MGYVTSARATLLALRLLAKGCFGSILRAPVRALCYQILLPTAVVWFVAFLDKGGTPRSEWPTTAIAGAVWLLFANSVNYGGMVLWHERWLLRQAVVPAWLVLTAAELVPIALFAVHLALVHLALLAGSFPQGGPPVATLFASGIAATSGLGAGILAARLSGFRTDVAVVLPKLLLASLVLTPVFYRLSALDGLKDAWALANPLSVATELARAGISLQTDALPRYAIFTACVLSGAILCWGLFTLRGHQPRLPTSNSEPALVLKGITKRLPDASARRGLSARLAQLARIAGLSLEGVPNTGRPVVESVDVTLHAGEIAILVGPPGSGKTSLLKIAAGLLRPTAGVVRLEGGSASLIYPKAGWHTGLTARENLVLRGVAQGLDNSEAQRRCERIASFAEIGDDLDRPGQNYPDVMLARLAFGAMAFLGPRVLVWDDVLESDPAFRQKCLAVIPTLLREGKAILMATHDVGKAEEISPRAIWIEEGRVRADGATRDVLEQYLEPRVTVAPLDPAGESAAVSRLAAVGLLDKHGEPATCYFPGDPITVAIELELTRRVELPYFLISIAGAFGPIAAASMFHDGCRPPFIDGRYRIQCTFEKLILAPKQRFTVRFALYAADGTTILYPKRVIASFVTGGSAAGCGFVHILAEGRILGGPPVLADYKWTMPGGIEKVWTSRVMESERTRATAVEGTRT
jgi:lipopolysaccharide transport system ATP-binding protein